jgi:hypothetical protein
MTTDEEANNKPCSSDAAANKLAISGEQLPSTDAQVKDKTSSTESGATKVDATDGDIKEPSVASEVEMKDGVAINEPSDNIDFKIVYNKQNYNVSFSLSASILSLKQHIETLTGVPHSMQKLVYKGKPDDVKTLGECGLVKGAKVMVIGSTLTDVFAVAAPSGVTSTSKGETVAVAETKEPLSRGKLHKKIIDKGVPADAMQAWRNGKVPLPVEPLNGMVNKGGGKVRLTFKLEADQVWIGTKERTEKVSMQSIRDIVSEPIEGHEEYHMLALQLGPTEASRYWIYWVPAQYVDAIKETILGS